ncbi:hypothetical protein O181_073521 [Austropuccinia psidii MF-1]|uniref:Uncharacterized protein n=1 Tax=Austropuccinia psidii MF-1 TaxID=1389203 RepID=A0A9Q3F4S5_9BASI|nr:hypothetical protein [Austropuccinia psidii MF-1]
MFSDQIETSIIPCVRPSAIKGHFQQESFLSEATQNNTHIKTHENDSRPYTPSQALTPGLRMVNKPSYLEAHSPAMLIQTPKIATHPVPTLTSESIPQKRSEFFHLFCRFLPVIL